MKMRTRFRIPNSRIHRAGRASSSRSSEEPSADSLAGEGHVWACAGASGDDEGHRASGEGVAGSRRGSLLGPIAPDEPLDESGSGSEAEPETLEAETLVHWAQGSAPREDPGLGTDVLLPRLTLEARLRRERSPGPCGSRMEPWEPEDEAEAALQRHLELSLGPGLEAPHLPGARAGASGKAWKTRRTWPDFDLCATALCCCASEVSPGLDLRMGAPREAVEAGIPFPWDQMWLLCIIQAAVRHQTPVGRRL
ncbi:hypothetical protein MC885_014511, partial [Smutsia gigantea]